MTKLHEAVIAQDELLVTQLVSEDTVNVPDAQGRTPLHLTAEYTEDIKKNQNIINALIKTGSDLDAEDNDSCIPLLKGICMGGMPLLNCLKDLNHTKRYLQDVEGAISIFLDAVSYNNPDVLTWILSTQSPDFVNYQLQDFRRGASSALHRAIELNCLASFIGLLKRPNIKLHQINAINHAPIHYAVDNGNTKFFEILWPLLCQSNLISFQDWIELFKYTYYQYIPLKKLPIESKTTQKIELESQDYQLIQPLFFEALLANVPQDITYDSSLALVMDCLNDENIESVAICKQLEDLNLSKKTYLKIKFMMVIAVVIAHANAFGLSKATPLSGNQRFIAQALRLWDQDMKNMLHKALYTILYPHYVTRYAQMRLQIAQNCPVYQSSNDNKTFEFNPEQILAFIWPRWDIEHKCQTLSAWFCLSTVLKGRLPTELKEHVMRQLCWDSLEQIIIDHVPLLYYYNIHQNAKITEQVFLKLCEYFDIFYTSFQKFVTLQKKHKDLSTQALKDTLDDQFAIFFETKESLKTKVCSAAESQLEGLLDAIKDQESKKHEQNNTLALRR